MDNLKFTESEIHDVMQVVAIVLHTGNISFKQNEDHGIIENQAGNFL